MAMFQPDINAGVATSLRDIVGGGTAMQYISEQNDMRRRMNPINENLSLADLERMNIANEQSRVTNPLEATIKGAAAREAAGKGDAYFTGMRGGELAKARKAGLEADIMAGTKDATIASTNAKLSQEQRAMINNEIKERAIWMANTLPPEEYAPALTQFASKIPGMVESPQFQALLKLPPQKMLEVLQKIGDAGRAADPVLRNADRISAEDNTAKLQVANIEAGATRYAADARKKEQTAELAKIWSKLPVSTRIAEMGALIAAAKAANEPTISIPVGGGIKDLPVATVEAMYKTIFADKASLDANKPGINTIQDGKIVPRPDPVPAAGRSGGFLTTPGGARYTIEQTN